MENTRVVSIIGLEKADYPYYLSKVLDEKKYRVLTIDNSYSHDLFLSMKRIDEDVDYVERGRCVYMRNKRVEEDEAGAFEKFDVVIIYHGYNVDYDMLEMSDSVVLMLDYIPSNIRTLISEVDMSCIEEFDKEKLFVIYRDKVGSKIDEQYLRNQLGLTQLENEYIIYYDENNLSTYLNFCYNGEQQVKGISSELKASVHAVKTFLVGDDSKKKRERKKKKEEKKNNKKGKKL